MKSKLKDKVEKTINKVGDAEYQEINIRGGAVDEILSLIKKEILSLIKKEILLGMPKKYKSDWCMNEAERKYVEGENDTLKEVRDYIKSLE